MTLDRKLRVILTDINRRQPIDILATFSKVHVVPWPSALPDPGAIETVSMDIRRLPGSRQGAAAGRADRDQLQVIRAATGALNSVRIAMGGKLPTKQATSSEEHLIERGISNQLHQSGNT